MVKQTLNEDYSLPICVTVRRLCKEMNDLYNIDPALEKEIVRAFLAAHDEYDNYEADEDEFNDIIDELDDFA